MDFHLFFAKISNNDSTKEPTKKYQQHQQLLAQIDEMTKKTRKSKENAGQSDNDEAINLSQQNEDEDEENLKKAQNLD